CVPCSVPGHLLRADAGIRLLCPVPVTSGRTGAAAGGKFKNFKKCHFFFFLLYQSISHTFCF
ncbi:unnamed protein product, partial [Staurois parvus]